MDEGERILTSKGLPIWIRRVQPEDAHHLVDIFEHMGVESRYNRFNVSLIDPDPELVLQTAIEMASVAAPEGEGFLAFTEVENEGLTPIGGARYVRTGPAEAEVSVAVRDDFQQQGVGTALLMETLQAAKAAGVTNITAGVRMDNLSVRALVKKIPWPVDWDHDGPYATVLINLSQFPDEEEQ